MQQTYALNRHVAQCVHMNLVRFDWDEHNIGKVEHHRITPEEAEQVLDNDPTLQRRQTYGQKLPIFQLALSSRPRALQLSYARERPFYPKCPTSSFRVHRILFNALFRECDSPIRVRKHSPSLYLPLTAFSRNSISTTLRCAQRTQKEVEQ